MAGWYIRLAKMSKPMDGMVHQLYSSAVWRKTLVGGVVYQVFMML